MSESLETVCSRLNESGATVARAYKTADAAAFSNLWMQAPVRERFIANFNRLVESKKMNSGTNEECWINCQKFVCLSQAYFERLQKGILKYEHACLISDAFDVLLGDMLLTEVRVVQLEHINSHVF